MNEWLEIVGWVLLLAVLLMMQQKLARKGKERPFLAENVGGENEYS